MFNWSKENQSFEKNINNQLAYRLHYNIIDKNNQKVMVLDHIFINPEIKNDLTDSLLTQVIDFAKDNQYKIWPLGPKTLKYFKEHPELVKSVWYSNT